MAASATDKFQKVGLSTATTLSAPGYTVGNTSITVGSTAEWPTDTGVTFAIDTVTIVNGEEVQDPGSYNEFVGTVATGTTITNVDWENGDGDMDYSAGSTTRVYIPVSKTRENRLVEGMTAEHNQDGTHGAVTATSVTASGTVQGATVVSTGDVQQRSVSMETLRSHYVFDHVQTGLVWSGDSYGSTRAASMTAGYVYINGRRSSQIAAVTGRTFTASKDTYVDVDVTGTITYTEVNNNAASPALAANNVRIAIIVTGASNIANVGSVNQGQEDKVLPIASSIPYAVTDSLGNLICPRDPNRRILGFRRITSSVTTTSGSDTQMTGVSCPVIVPADRKILVSVYVPFLTVTSASIPLVSIYDGAVGVGTAIQYTRAKPADNQGALAQTVVTPTSTSKTYNGAFSTTAGTLTANAASTSPVYILVELK